MWEILRGADQEQNAALMLKGLCCRPPRARASSHGDPQSSKPLASPEEESIVVELLNISGAPGTGKTTSLLQLYVRACEIAGPERVMAITFTRAGADELRTRCAASLGIQGSTWDLRRRMPFVGTIHSMCLRLADIPPNKLIAGANSKLLREFDKRLDKVNLPSIEYMDTWEASDLTSGSEDVEIALRTHGAARHRLIPLEDAWALVDPEIAARSSFSAIQRLVESYERWKREHEYCDFEDLLMLGRELRPPVRVVLADECQDNSPLLWSVIDAWGTNRSIASFVCAGDAFQALYSFAGGDPRLFSGRDGNWHVIRQSHRFDGRSATYAQRLLVPAFGRDERFEDLTTWEGVGGTGPQDTSRFWLARTNTLVGIKAAQLQQDGEPYAFIRGRAPLQTKAADAYRSILRAEAGNLISRDEIVALSNMKGLPGGLGREKFLRGLPPGYYGAGSIEAAFSTTLRALLAQLPYSQYFARLRARFGDDVVFQRPALALGTVHASKGKEAGSVTVCRNWATKPYANMRSVDGRRAETCCAYVAATRHKQSLKFETLAGVSGGIYGFPSS